MTKAQRRALIAMHAAGCATMSNKYGWLIAGKPGEPANQLSPSRRTMQALIGMGLIDRTWIANEPHLHKYVLTPTGMAVAEKQT